MKQKRNMDYWFYRSQHIRLKLKKNKEILQTKIFFSLGLKYEIYLLF